MNRAYLVFLVGSVLIQSCLSLSGTLERGDDDKFAKIDVTGFTYFNTTYTSIYLNTNGIFTFTVFTPVPFPITNKPAIAPYWADVDTRNAASGLVTWNLTTGSDSKLNAIVKANYPIPTFNTTFKLEAVWTNVGYYNTKADKLNTFNATLFCDSRKNCFALFEYSKLQWTTGDASDGVNGLGGKQAQVGFDKGDGVNYFAHPYSFTNNTLLMTTVTNVNQPGRLLYQVNGGVPDPGCGNAVIDAGEECDLGLANSNTGNCTSECKLPVCGDGIVQPGKSEECDLGASNGLYSGCFSNCKIDNIAPIAPTIVTPNSLTNQTRPVIDGAAEPFSTVSIYIDSVLVGQVASTAQGNYTFAPNTLTDGVHTVKVNASDANNNKSPQTVKSFTVDSTAPTSPLISNPTTGSLTNNNARTITGTAEAGASVTIYIDGVNVGTVVSTGSFSFTTTFTDGSHSIYAKATDSAGNTSPQSSTTTFTVDTTPPTKPTVTTPANGAIINTLIIRGTAEATGIVNVYINGTLVGSTVPIGGSYSFTPSAVADGPHTVYVTSIDAAGNVSPQSDVKTFTLDTAAPEKPIIISPVSGTRSNIYKPQVNGTAEPNSIVNIYANSVRVGNVTADGYGNFSFTIITLADGNHMIKATATDQSGNVSPFSNTTLYTIDVTPPPRPIIVTPSNNYVFGTTTPVIIGVAETGVIVSIYVDGALIGNTTAFGSFDFIFPTSVPLAQGNHTMYATATDAVGNTSPPSVGRIFYIDTVPPTTPTIVLASTVGATPTISGTAEAGSLVSISIDGVSVGNVTANNAGSYTLTYGPLTTGNHTVTVTATDSVGNVSPNATKSFTVDATAPVTPTITSPTASSSVNTAHPVISGTAEAGSVTTIYVDNVAVGNATADGTGRFNFTVTLSDGSHTVKALSTDAYGNTSPLSSTTTFTVDTAIPTAPLILSPSSGETIGTNKPQIVGSAEPGANITVYIDGVFAGQVTTNAQGNFSFTPSSNFTDGTHTTQVSATDAAGNVSPLSAVRSFVTDTTTSSPTVSSPVTGQVSSTTKPVITGTAEPGATVTIYIDNVVVGTTTANANGNFTFTTSSTLSDGLHSVKVEATDSVGNVSPTSNVATFTVDTVSPTGPVVASPLNNAFVKDNKPEISGTAEQGSTVSVYIDGVKVFETVSGQGNFSYTPISALSDGVHNVTVYSKDSANNISPGSTNRFTVDTLVPTTPVIIAPTNGNTVGTSNPIVSGTAEAGTTVSISIDGVSVGSTTANGAGNFNFTIPTAIPDGPHNVTVTTTDAAGNTSPGTSKSFIVDTTAPNAPIIGSPVSGDSINDNTPQVSGTAEPGATVELYIDSVLVASITADGSGNFTYTLGSALSDGTHTVTVNQVDAGGNVSPANTTASFIVDTLSPSAPIIDTPVDQSLSDSQSVPVTGTAEAGTILIVEVDGTVVATLTVPADRNFNYTATLSDGSHNITVYVQDAADNTSPRTTIIVNVDTQAPASPSVTSLTNGQTVGPTTTISGDAEPGSVVTIYVDGVVVGNTTADANGSFTFTIGPLTDGPHTLTETATDSTGNTSPMSNEYTIIVDATGPNTPTIYRPTSDSYTNNNKPEVSGTVEPYAVVTIIIDGEEAGTTTADASGDFTFIPSSPLADGTHNVSVIATDGFGNVSPPSLPTPFIVDTLPPTAPVITVPSDDETLPSGTTLSGTAEPSSQVTITIDGSVVGNVTTDSNGNFEFILPTLPDGPHTITATNTDAAGNTSPSSAVKSITIDGTAPLPPTITSPQDGSSINDNTPTVTGTAEPGSTITVEVDGVPVGNTTADASGNYTLPLPSSLPDGNHTITITATDAEGNTSPAGSSTVTVDTVVPVTPSITSPQQDQKVSTSTPTVTGTCEVNSLVTVYVDESSVGTTTADASGEFSYTSTLTDGVHDVKVTCTDDAGNVSPYSNTNQFQVDTVAPQTPEVTSLADNEVVAPTIPVSGNAEPGSVVTVYIDGVVVGNTTADANGNFTFIVGPLSDGPHTIAQTSTDATGNTSPKSSEKPFVTDATGPNTPNVDKPSSGASLNNNKPEVSGRVEPNAVVTIIIDGEEAGTTTADAAGDFTFIPTSPLADGPHNVSVTATDGFGNISPPSPPIPFIVDTLPPTAPVVTVPSDDETVPSGTTLSGAAEPNSQVTISIDGSVVANVTTNASGNFNFVLPTLPDGPHTITATNTDAAGNTSPSSAVKSITIDGTAPLPPTISSPQDGSSINDNTPTVTGTAEPGSVITVEVDGVPVGSTTTDASGNYTLPLPSSLPDGNHTITITATDAEGNTSPVGSSTIIVDTVMPVTPSVSSPQQDQKVSTSTPTVTGTCEAYSSVTVYIDGSSVGTTNADASGDFSFTSSLSEGIHDVKVTCTDDAGNVSPYSSTNQFQVDTAAPQVPVVTSLADNEVVAPTIPVSGNAEPGSVVTVYIDGVVVGNTTADANGNFTFTIGPLPDGPHTIAQTSTDATGNTSPKSSEKPFVTDATGPNTPSVDKPTSGSHLNNNQPEISGTVEPNAVVTIIIDGEEAGTTTADDSGDFTFTPTSPLADGPHNVSITATDGFGNVSPPSPLTPFIVDTQPPAAPVVTSPTDDDTVPSGSKVKGTAEPNSLITVIVDGEVVGNTTSDSSGNFEFTLPTLPDGPHTVTVTNTDEARNTSPASSDKLITIDGTAPLPPTITSPQDGSSTKNEKPSVTGTAEPGSTIIVEVDGVPVGNTTADESGNFVLPLPSSLPDGNHTITVTATDPEGNTSPGDTITITVDTVVPQVPVVVSPASNEILPSNTPHVNGTCEENSLVTIYIDNVVIGTTTADESGKFTLLSSALSDGTHTVKATCTDDAENVSPDSNTNYFQIDTAAPSVPVITLPLNQSIIGSSSVTIQGDATADSYVSIYLNDQVYAAQANAQGAFEKTVTLVDGLYSVYATSADDARNESPASETVLFTVDTTAPSNPVITSPVNNFVFKTSAAHIVGTSDPHDEITIYVDDIQKRLVHDQSIPTTVADARGNWNKTIEGLSDGQHRVYVVAKRRNGLYSQNSNSETFTIDTSTPTPTPVPSGYNCPPGSRLAITDKIAPFQYDLANGEVFDQAMVVTKNNGNFTVQVTPQIKCYFVNQKNNQLSLFFTGSASCASIQKVHFCVHN